MTKFILYLAVRVFRIHDAPPRIVGDISANPGQRSIIADDVFVETRLPFESVKSLPATSGRHRGLEGSDDYAQ